LIRAISNIQNIQSVTFPNIINIRSVNGKVPVPVRPFYSISAVFKHISVVPSNVGNNGIPLYKLRILDNLLDRFIRNGNAKHLKITEKNVDSLIDEFSNKLKLQSFAGGRYEILFRPEKGLIINLVA